MQQYLDALQYIMDNGETVNDRTGIGTKSVFGYQMRFNLQEGFPAVTTKKLAWKAVVGELLWFLEGSDDERRLAEITFEDDRTNLYEKKTIWTANADKQGKDLGYENNDLYKVLGPVYGVQWRNFNQEGKYVGDQINQIISQLKENPESRRIILSAWNPNQLNQMTLPPCHVLTQFYVNTYPLEKRLGIFKEKFPEIDHNGTGYFDLEKMMDNYNIPRGKLSAQMYQRSADMFLGVPFNIASYSLLIHMIAQITNLDVGEFVHTIGDAHIYLNHLEQVKEQVGRSPGKLPTLEMPEFKNLRELLKTKPSQYILNDYDPMPSIKAPMAV